ncbi:MAG: DUF983 domain-containing protein [Rhizobiaceae bacterium]
MASSHDKALYPPVSPVTVGLKGTCPRCGQGRLFAGVLKPAKECMNCKLDYSFIDSGDGPAVFVIMIMGFVLLGAALAFDNMFHPPIWVHVILWGPVIIFSCLWTLRISKGFMIALQFNTDAKQGTLADDSDET